MMVISLKMRDPGFEIFIESGFSDGNHCLKCSHGAHRVFNTTATTQQKFNTTEFGPN